MLIRLEGSQCGNEPHCNLRRQGKSVRLSSQAWGLQLVQSLGQTHAQLCSRGHVHPWGWWRRQATSASFILALGVQTFTLGSPSFHYALQSVQSLSRVRLFATPWTAARQASLSIINSQRLLKLMSIESVMSSNHLILCPSTSSCFSSCHWGGPIATSCSTLRAETWYRGNKQQRL